MHLCQRRKTGKCIDEADVVKILSGKGIEKISMDLRQFLYCNLEALKIFSIYFTSTFAHEAVSSTHEKIFVDKRGNECFPA